jgi:hypothetical protein
MKEIARWTVFEAALRSERTYDDPFWDVDLQVTFTSPSGRRRVVDAFWDGSDDGADAGDHSGRERGRTADRVTWRVRFCPDEVGRWRWKSRSSEEGDTGLHQQTGEFACVPYAGENPLYRHGSLTVAEDGRHLAHADGEPFFWLGDTAWNGVIRSRAADWERYLRTRGEQGFSVIQFVSTQWRGWSADPGSKRQSAFTGTGRIEINPRFFQRLDPKVKAINAHGLTAAPVMLWAYTESDPGQRLSEASAIRLARHLVARWGAYHVVWFVGGDGHYEGARAERWHRIGRAVFDRHHDHLVTLHPCGGRWIRDEFASEPWFDFVGYQSSHSAAPDRLRWLTQSPPATAWQKSPALPVINLEPNYEAHPIRGEAKRPHPSLLGEGPRFTDYEVRRASYWSLLVSPTAGVTFGHNAIWVWPEEPSLADGHEDLGPVDPWHCGLETPGVRSMSVLSQFFRSLPWWRLRPAQHLLVEQPGADDVRRFVAAALVEEKGIAVVYMPVGGPLRLDTLPLGRQIVARWIDPRTGDVAGNRTTHGSHEGGRIIDLMAPDDRDWILRIERHSTEPE